MSTLTILIVCVFCVGYLCIALESLTRVNKAAIALLMCVLLDPADDGACSLLPRYPWRGGGSPHC